ncbi:FMNH2-dependent monooxygenase [Streptomyces sp. NPDC087440]|uniref:FMNH2-dependent monooxygenase n=1 Tax=Streptomyces sp. NPDC087440 TaxID=3365790 RepID=UPI003817D191
MGSAVSRPLHLGAEIGGGGGVAARVRLAENGALDFVTLAGAQLLARAGAEPLDGLVRGAADTCRVGLVPTVTAPAAAPAPTREALRTLFREGRGRVGRGVDAAAQDAEAALLEGETPGAGPERPVVVVDVTACGADGLAVAAYGADVVLVRAYSPGEAGVMRADLRRRAAAAGRDPDDVRVLAALTVGLAGEPHLDGPPALDPEAVRIGQDGAARYTGGPVGLAQVLTRWHAADVVDGFHVTPLEPDRDLERLVNGTVTLLQHRCLLRHFYSGATLREHLGLPDPARRHTAGSRA